MDEYKYNIWTVRHDGISWSYGPIRAASPEAALRAANRTNSDNSWLLADDDVVIVAASTGGHGNAAVFKIHRPQEAEPQDQGVVKVVVL